MSNATWAERYVDRFALALTPLRGKVPICEGWNLDENLLRTAGAARDYFSRNPHDNMGACLEASGLVSVDADHPEGARRVLAAEGIDLDALIASTPTIIGRAPRLEFKAPNAPLGRKSVVWPPKAVGEKPVTVVELRAGRVQDVLPPSIHPDTKQPYRWITPPRDGFPPLPESLLALWQDFDAFKHRARNLCPWADPEPEAAPPPPRRASRERTGPSVIAAFNDAHDAVSILESHGYVRAGKKRWKSPNGHGVAGVVVLPSGKVFCHHQSDDLGNGHAHDAFDLFRLFDHSGDYHSAVKAAAQVLGMNQVAT
jgi:putative DNA primase/helicase